MMAASMLGGGRWTAEFTARSSTWGTWYYPLNMEISSPGAAWMSTSVGDWSCARIHPWPEGPDQGGYMSDSLNSIYLEMVTSFPSLTFLTNVIAQTSAIAERTWLSAVWNHICAYVYVYLDRRWYGSTGRSKVQLAIIFGLYSLQAVLQDASQRLISWLFFVSQGVHLLYELLDLIYNSAQHNCDIQSSEDQSIGKCYVSTQIIPRMLIGSLSGWDEQNNLIWKSLKPDIQPGKRELCGRGNVTIAWSRGLLWTTVAQQQEDNYMWKKCTFMSVFKFLMRK